MMALGLTVKAAGAMLELLLPDILSHIIDDVVPRKEEGTVVMWAVIMGVCALGAWILNVLANRNASRVARDVTRKVRHDLFEHTLYLSCEKTDAFTIPSLESRMTSDTYHLHRMIGMMQRMGVRAPIITVGGLILCFVMEPVLALVFLAVIPLMLAVVSFRASKGVPLFRGVQRASDRIAALTRETAGGIRVIKAFSRTDYEKGRFEKADADLRKKEIHANTVMALINPLMNLFLYGGMIGVILLGAWRVQAGLSETGKILAFINYFQMISRSLMAVSRMFIMYSRGMASSARIMEVLNTETERDWNPGAYPAGNPAYVIEFRDVSFSYLKIQENLSHISFGLKKGQTLGVIGATGSGKTTILSLLLHFYHADEGAVYVNGRDIRSMRPDDLRRQFGVVMQNDFLFADTIAGNIRFGRDVKVKDLKEAAANAQADEFIADLSDHFEHHLTSRGTNLSGGQEQRILLARAFVAKPAVLLLDDAGSALDYSTDAKLRKAIALQYPDTTEIIIAQRVSSIRNCDQILVLDHGKIAEAGTDAELMKENGLYASISASQMGGALFD